MTMRPCMQKLVNLIFLVWKMKRKNGISVSATTDLRSLLENVGDKKKFFRCYEYVL
jgi:hypothetical protein